MHACSCSFEYKWGQFHDFNSALLARSWHLDGWYWLTWGFMNDLVYYLRIVVLFLFLQNIRTRQYTASLFGNGLSIFHLSCYSTKYLKDCKRQGFYQASSVFLHIRIFFNQPTSDANCWCSKKQLALPPLNSFYYNPSKKLYKVIYNKQCHHKHLHSVWAAL